MKDFHTAPATGNESSRSDDAIEAWKQLRGVAGSAEVHTSFALEELRKTLSNLPVPDIEIHAPEPPATQKQAAEQTEHLAEMRLLVAALTQTIQNAEADRAKAEADQAEQKTFNNRMTITAIALAFAAVIAPFLIYFLEHGWWWEAYRP